MLDAPAAFLLYLPKHVLDPADSRDPDHTRSTIAVFLVARTGFAFAFALFATVAALRRIMDLGFDPLALVLVGSVLEGSALLFEVPTGVFADVFGRKRSVVIGYAVVGLGFAIEGLSTSLVGVLLAQVVWGGGWTFVSGARSAWLADEIGEQTAAAVYLRASQWSQAAALLGIAIAAGVAATTSLVVPIHLGAASFGLTALFLSAAMRETGFTPRPRDATKRGSAFGHTLAAGARALRERPSLVTLMAVAFFAGMSSEGFDRLWQLHLIDDIGLPAAGVPVIIWFGGLDAAALVLGMLSLALVRAKVDPNDLQRLPGVLIWMQSAVMVATAGFAVSGHFALAVAALWTARVAREVQGPLMLSWVNRSLDPASRATVLSIYAQSDAFGQIAGGPGLGLVGRVSLPAS